MESRPKLKDTFEERQKRIDRILAGTEDKLDPAMQKYADERKNLFRSEWINPSVEEKAV